MDRERLKRAAERLRKPCAEFLRDLCRIPATSNQEGPVVARIKKEMTKVGFDEIRVDKYGNILGRIGKGPRVIACDSHIDTVGVGDPAEWKWDPFRGKYENGVIWARGSSDQRGGMAAMVYAGKLIKDLKLAADCTIWMVGSICEEDSDGIAWLYILKEKVISPEIVIVTEPTNLKIYRGHRGRMEIKVRIPGRSCHGSAPERGDNPITKAAPFLLEIERLNKRLRPHPFLGKGTVCATQIREDGPSQCAVPGAVTVHLDRRLAPGETKNSALREVREALKRAGISKAKVWVPIYREPSWRNTVYPMEQYYPGWCLDADHSLVRISKETYRGVFGRKPIVDKWIFSTNATTITGICGVPAIGFGAGNEDNAHSVKEHMPVDHLVKAMQFYAAFPTVYSQAGGLDKADRRYRA
ncbi:MAG: YgeY family selenium metabolism-linked hydrolase [Candidatus Hydrogenedentota bacterium]|nr:MAG: YgeY family selenium metabolism-linked hydrolase [Candidatus Hydrogenedentota bacterium]